MCYREILICGGSNPAVDASGDNVGSKSSQDPAIDSVSKHSIHLLSGLSFCQCIRMVLNSQGIAGGWVQDPERLPEKRVMASMSLLPTGECVVVDFSRIRN